MTRRTRPGFVVRRAWPTGSGASSALARALRAVSRAAIIAVDCKSDQWLVAAAAPPEGGTAASELFLFALLRASDGGASWRVVCFLVMAALMADRI